MWEKGEVHTKRGKFEYFKKGANKEWNNMSLVHVERRDSYFAKPSSGGVVQSRLNYYAFHDLPTYDVTEKLAGITVPTTIYCGRYDAQCPLHFSEEIDHRITSSTLHVFEHSNHYPFLEEQQQFGEMIETFAKR